VLGELIGKTLVEKAAVKPDIVLTEGEDLLELRSHVSQPVAIVENADKGLRLGRQSLRFHPSHSEDEPRLARSAGAVPDQADLFEPFDRVREALQETVKAGAGR
jgi:hypothetical protein